MYLPSCPAKKICHVVVKRGREPRSASNARQANIVATRPASTAAMLSTRVGAVISASRGPMRRHCVTNAITRKTTVAMAKEIRTHRVRSTASTNDTAAGMDALLNLMSEPSHSANGGDHEVPADRAAEGFASG